MTLGKRRQGRNLKIKQILSMALYIKGYFRFHQTLLDKRKNTIITDERAINQQTRRRNSMADSIAVD